MVTPLERGYELDLPLSSREGLEEYSFNHGTVLLFEKPQ